MGWWCRVGAFGVEGRASKLAWVQNRPSVLINIPLPSLQKEQPSEEGSWEMAKGKETC